MKRLVALLTVFILLLTGSAFAETSNHQIEKKNYPFYFKEPTNIWKEDYPLYFLDGVADLPYIELNNLAETLNYVCVKAGGSLYDHYSVSIEMDEDNQQVQFTRENGYHMMFDFGNDLIIFDDYDGFLMPTENEMYMDLSNLPVTDQSGQPYLLTCVNSRNRYGDLIVVDLKDYEIELVAQDGLYLVPMQTAAAFLFNHPSGIGLYFNGQGIFCRDVDKMAVPGQDFLLDMHNRGLLTPEILQKSVLIDGTPEEEMNYAIELIGSASEEGAKLVEEYKKNLEKNLYSLYSDVPGAERSQTLIDYGYHELCMELDCFYGLKEEHNIKDFNTFFLQTGLTENLMDPDAALADSAIADLTYYWLDDSHSAFISPSWMTSDTPDQNLGFSINLFERTSNIIKEVRSGYPEAAQAYYEVGDTAYVTFDEFLVSENPDDSFVDYYALADSSSLPEDTIGIINDAHRQITRENSPVRNVVLDLSSNTGGMAAAALYTLGWFMGDGEISIHNTFTGSESSMTYRADVNLDHQFDKNDTLAGRGLNLYCLVSPQSFSCGNLVPWAFKADGQVTLLGKVSGGGSCAVGFITSAWGTSYRISDPLRLAFVKNGSYYNVDRGVEPDVFIRSYDTYFDRQALTELIHGIK